MTLKTVVLLVCFFISENVYALCSASDVAVNFDKNILIQRDVPVGTVLATVTTSNAITCDALSQSQQESSWSIQLDGANIDHGASSLADVRATNINGIGIRWKNYSSTTATTGVVTKQALNDAGWLRGISQNGITNFTDTFELIKTNTTPATAALSPFTIYMVYSTPVSSNVIRQPLYKYVFSAVNTNTVSCRVLDDNLIVDMGFAVISKFKGPGSTQNSSDFNISLNCDPLTSVNVTLDNVTPLEDMVNGVLGLSSNSTAKGVGIQVMHNNLPVKFGNLINYGSAPIAGGVVKIPFTASYYQTQSTIRPGTVYATASFSLTYQ